MDEILADYNEAELELLAGFLQKVTAAGVIAAALSDRGMLSHRGQHPPQKLSPLVDRINDRYGRCAVDFRLFPPGARAFKGHAAFHRVPEKWEFLVSP
jgi:hypothetical protein